ncbi:Methionine import ATP-binding protein MetN [compost metagenome]
MQQVSKRYTSSGGMLEAVKSVSLTIEKGSIHGIIGTSGAGKSTLLRMMNALEQPDEGTVTVGGHKLTDMSAEKLRNARRSIGMIFQHFHLLHNRTVSGNVAVPLELAGMSKREREARVAECLKFVGLEDKAEQYPSRLSGGQKQRVAIARALANHPDVLLCDEPTSSLDPNTTQEILEVLRHINEKLGVTIVIVTHEMDVIRSICHHVSVMENGRLTDAFAMDRSPEKQAPRVLLSYREQLLGKAGDGRV